MIAHFGPGIEIPLHPFFGSMGVAPPPAFGRYDSTAPTIIGGNMDNKELVAGTTLLHPRSVNGALFEVGDGHAGQGNGEVDVTAHGDLAGRDAAVHRAQGHEAAYPRAETPTHYIAMGFDDDLSIATRKAVRNMVDFLVARKASAATTPTCWLSVAGDLAVTEVVDRNKGVHVVLPKTMFTK